MQPLKDKWRALDARRLGPGHGIPCYLNGYALTSLRFADDILLFARSREDLRKMLRDFRNEVLKYGLRLHMGKTNVLTTADLQGRTRSVRINNDKVEILEQSSSEKYLGRQLAMAFFSYYGGRA